MIAPFHPNVVTYISYEQSCVPRGIEEYGLYCVTTDYGVRHIHDLNAARCWTVARLESDLTLAIPVESKLSLSEARETALRLDDETPEPVLVGARTNLKADSRGGNGPRIVSRKVDGTNHAACGKDGLKRLKTRNSR